MLPILGIIAGNGKLPLTIAKIYNDLGGKCYIASITEDNRSWPAQSKNFTLGSVGAILKYFNESKVENVILVGSVQKPDFKTLKVDLSSSVLLSKILKEKFLGDDNILKIICSYIESKGFKVIFPMDILKSTNYQKFLTKLSPSKQDIIDIEIGSRVLSSLGKVDVGQSVIVCNGYVLGVEAAEGTDNLIRRCDLLRKTKKGGVLVKMSKSGQDMRVDVPVIGLDTTSLLKKHGFNGVAIETSGVIIIDPEEVLDFANENQLFLKFI